MIRSICILVLLTSVFTGELVQSLTVLDSFELSPLELPAESESESEKKEGAEDETEFKIVQDSQDINTMESSNTSAWNDTSLLNSASIEIITPPPEQI